MCQAHEPLMIIHFHFHFINTNTYVLMCRSTTLQSIILALTSLGKDHCDFNGKYSNGIFLRTCDILSFDLAKDKRECTIEGEHKVPPSLPKPPNKGRASSLSFHHIFRKSDQCICAACMH